MESENLEKYQDISKLLKVTKTGDKVKVSILFKVSICEITIPVFLM